MKFTLRLVTVICYFLPFTFFLTTCNNGELIYSYNRNEADKNILLESESSKVAVADTARHDTLSVETINADSSSQIIPNETGKTSYDTSQKSTDYGAMIIGKLLYPTDTSLSGIGSVIFSKNLIGQIAIAISLLISLVLFVAFKFLKSQRTKLYLLLVGVLCLTIFIVDSIVSSVTLLWGSWTLLIVLILQLILEFKDMTKDYR